MVGRGRLRSTAESQNSPVVPNNANDVIFKQYQLSIRERFRLAIPERLADSVWPSARPHTSKERQRQIEKKHERTEAVAKRLMNWENFNDGERDVIRHEIESILEVEEKRRASVHARLSALIGMAAIAISVTFAMAGLVLNKSTIDLPSLFIIGFMFTAFYIALQFIFTVQAAVKVIQRVNVTALNAVDILCDNGENNAARTKRIIEILIKQFEDLQESTNKSVTQMAIAHTALRNACWCVLVSIVVLGGAVVWKNTHEANVDIEQHIINRIRCDNSLADFLRGPKGIQGPEGYKGERGEKGDKGDKGDRGPPGVVLKKS